MTRLSTDLLEELHESESAAPLCAVVSVDGDTLDNAKLGEIGGQLLLRYVHSVLALSEPANEHLQIEITSENKPKREGSSTRRGGTRRW